MGTRGFLGFVVGGTEKIGYSHFDSYPEGLGVWVLRWLRDHSSHSARMRLVDLAASLRVVSDDVPPTPQDVEELAEYTDLSRGELLSDGPSWYQLLRGTQGDPEAILRSGRIEDASSFSLDSLFCEWGYLVDLDSMMLEVYQGHQREPHTRGRWSEEEPWRQGWYPCALEAIWLLDLLPGDAEFVRRLREGSPLG